VEEQTAKRLQKPVSGTYRVRQTRGEWISPIETPKGQEPYGSVLWYA